MPRDTDLPRSAPAEQGVASAGVEAFLDAVAAAPDLELHSLMLLRHGHVVAQGWWAPYGPDQVHLLYSLSKSFTATAAGFARAEGLLSFDDPVVAHFPELADAATHPWTRSLQVRHLAAMATGHHEDTLERALRLDPAEPVRGFLSIAPDAEPGSVFAYNNGATYTLGALVQRVSGQSLTAYLQPRLFDPLGIRPPYWREDPPGREIGFSGLHLTTEDVARFGQLLLDDGVRDGVPVLPPGWGAEASALHTPNPDWQQGYGYQLWRSRHGYRGDGAYGQFCLVLPEQDVVLVTTAQTENMQGLLDAVWAHLLPAIGTTTPGQDDALADRLHRLALPADGNRLSGSVLPEAVAAVSVSAVDPDPEGGWVLHVSDGEHQLEVLCGDGAWHRTTCTAPGGRELVVAASGTLSDGQLVAQLAFVQTPHRLVLRTDPRTLTGSARWLTVPLHAPTFDELAVRAGSSGT